MSDEAPVTPGLDQIAPLIELPDGAIPENGIVIINYLDPEGVPSYAVSELGETSQADLIGTMVLVIHDLMHERPDDDG